MSLKNFFIFLIISVIFITIIFLPSKSKNTLLETYKLKPSLIINSIPSPSTQTVTIGLAGDLGLGRYINSICRSKKDFSWPFLLTSSILQSNDFNLANLESPIIKDCPDGKTGTFIFCGDPGFLPYLKENKFILNLANNHILNYGQNGLNQTKNFLSQNQIDYFYSHNSDTEFIKKEINGITFGFLGFDFVTNPETDHQQIINLAKRYNSQVDWLIISLHWGNEYQPKPEKWRIDFAHQLVDAGADIIHGHHPHVYQPSEVYQGKPIFYSLGNFIFDQNWSEETSQSKFIILTLDHNQILRSDQKSYQIKYNSQPQFVD